MIDRVLEDEARYDRDCTAQEVLIEQGRAFAQTEYEAGQLDDWIEDEVNPHDTFLLAHALIRWIDSSDSLEKLAEYIPVCSLKDVRATIEHVIEMKAKMIAEDL